jgi:hypothetical protein
MIYKEFQGIKTSVLGMGNMRLPTTIKGWYAPIDYPKAQELIDYAIKNGVNYFDTAYDYHGGDSEKFLGEALINYPRESYYLATKFFVLANADYKAVFEEQLSRLKTNYIDFYLIHGIFDHTFQQYLDCGCIEYFEKQKAKGRIKYFGFSSHANMENLKTFANRRQWDFAQISLNYFDWFYGNSKEQYEILEKRNIPVIAMSPVRGGHLKSFSPEAESMLKNAQPDWSIISWAFYWLKSLPNVQVILSGISTLDDIKENATYFQDDEKLNEKQKKLLYEACEAFRSEVQIPCTACGYCCSPCPVKIEIVKMLELYNNYKVDGLWALYRMNEIESEGKPADCTGCGLCNERCPQSIDIKNIMKELVDLHKQMASYEEENEG